MKLTYCKTVLTFLFLFVCLLSFGQENVSIELNRLKEKQQIQFLIKGAKADEGYLVIRNSDDQIVLEEEMELNPLTSYYTFNTEKFKSGKYHVVITSKLETVETFFSIR